MQFWGEPQWEFVVPAAAFSPRPAVDAAVVSYRYKNIGIPAAQAERFGAFVDFVFAARRKKVVNRLATFLAGAASRAVLEDALAATGVPPAARPEDVAPDDFWRLYCLLEPYVEAGGVRRG